MDARYLALREWLATQCGLPQDKIVQLQGDASFRRYFRIFQQDKTFVAMDAPPPENCQPFVAIAAALKTLGLLVPEVKASDIKNGFLLLTDFGDKLLLRELTATNAEKLYKNALDNLEMLHRCQTINNWTIPFFTAEFMRKELELSKEWFLQKYLKLELSRSEETSLQKSFDFLANESAKQPQVFMHRDYHSANMMVLPQGKIGILDFQDAFWGPVTYDIVSLLRDCYIDWPENLVQTLFLYYRDKIMLPVGDAEFLSMCDVMSMQRHLKTLLTFSRKYCRDHNTQYLQYIPRTLHYLIQISARHVETKWLHEFLTEKVYHLCVQ